VAIVGEPCVQPSVAWLGMVVIVVKQVKVVKRFELWGSERVIRVF
jgi:hypothetical protein